MITMELTAKHDFFSEMGNLTEKAKRYIAEMQSLRLKLDAQLKNKHPLAKVYYDDLCRFKNNLLSVFHEMSLLLIEAG